MIDFSQYPERAPFIVQPRGIDLPGYEINPFHEAFFETKRKSYIHYLQENTTRFNLSIQETIRAASNPSAGDRQSAENILEVLATDSPYEIFFKEYPKDQSGNCLGTDYAYDLYRTLPNMASKLRGLYSFEEYFTTMFDDVYKLLYQIFQRIGTRGQLYGYIEAQILDYTIEIDTYIQELEAEADPDIRITLMPGIETRFLSAYTDFLTNVRTAASDMRDLVEPIVEYLNLSGIALDVMNTIWGNTLKNPELDDTLTEYSRATVAFAGDYNISNQGFSVQVLQGFEPYINEDRTNFEMIITKTVGTTFDELQINTRIKDTHSRFIIPNYNP